MHPWSRVSPRPSGRVSPAQLEADSIGRLSFGAGASDENAAWLRGGVWIFSLGMLGYGIWVRNPAAVLLAQIGWVAVAVTARRRLWTSIPWAALLLVFVYITIGELMWLLKVRGMAVSGPTSVGVVSLAGALASLMALFRRPTSADRPSQTGRASIHEVGPILGFYGICVPALSPGRQLIAAQYAFPGFEHMHNLVRTSLIDSTGYINYGESSPATHAVGDYYPRGLHLVAAILARAARLSPSPELQRWMVGYLHVFWLIWAVAALALGVAAYSVVHRLGGSATAANTTATLATLLLFAPPVLHRIVLPGFSAFSLAIVAVAVSVAVHFDVEKSRRLAAGSSLVAFAVASHAWQILAPVCLALALAAAWPGGVGRNRFLAGTPLARSLTGTAATVGLAVGVLATATRPWLTTVLSGDAGNQAQQAGFIEPVPGLMWVVCVAGVPLLTTRLLRARLLRWALIPAAAMAVMLLVIERETGWDSGRYYVQKMLWAVALLVLPLAFAGFILIADQSMARLRTRGTDTLRRLSGVGVILVALGVLHKPIAQLFLNQPLNDPRAVRAAEQAVETGGRYQVVALGFTTSYDDHLASMWGRAARDLRGLPALDVSEIDFSHTSRADFCSDARRVGVTIVFVDGTPGQTPALCPA